MAETKYSAFSSMKATTLVLFAGALLCLVSDANAAIPSITATATATATAITDAAALRSDKNLPKATSSTKSPIINSSINTKNSSMNDLSTGSGDGAFQFTTAAAAAAATSHTALLLEDDQTESKIPSTASYYLGRLLLPTLVTDFIEYLWNCNWMKVVVSYFWGYHIDEDRSANTPDPNQRNMKKEIKNSNKKKKVDEKHHTENPPPIMVMLFPTTQVVTVQQKSSLESKNSIGTTISNNNKNKKELGIAADNESTTTVATTSSLSSSLSSSSSWLSYLSGITCGKVKVKENKKVIFFPFFVGFDEYLVYQLRATWSAAKKLFADFCSAVENHRQHRSRNRTVFYEQQQRKKN